ncbi:MAG: hypothetical protein ACR2PT_16330 [Endozoicomonas sp.]
MISLPLNSWPRDTFEQTVQSRSYDTAMADIATKAAELDNPDAMEEEGYLLWVMGRLMMVEDLPAPPVELYDAHPEGSGVQVFRQRMGRVEFCHLLFEPGSVIPFHDHWNCNGVMRVLRGEVTTHNYDLLEQGLDGMVLQPSVQVWMTPGRMLSLSRHRDNIHQVTAGPDGAHVLDVFTLLGSGAGSRYMQVGAPGSASRSDLAIARWVHPENEE